MWELRYWSGGSTGSPVEKWLDKLSREQLASVAKELSILEEVGNELCLPHSRALSSGLFELRERRFGLRMYYCFHRSCVIILLAAGDKKTQKNDIKVARQRLAAIGKE